MLFDLGVLQSGEVPNPEDADFSLQLLNDWVNSLATEALSVYTLTRTTWTLTPNVASYTVGPSGTINIDRPINPQWIQAVGYINTAVSPTQELMLGRPLTQDAFMAIPQKTLTSPTPTTFYYDPTPGTFGTLKPFPIPTGANLQGVIYAPTAVPEFSTLNDTIALPPGYRRFLRTNLALELAPAFSAQVTPELGRNAEDSKRKVKDANVRMKDLSSGGWGWGWYDINSDMTF